MLLVVVIGATTEMIGGHILPKAGHDGPGPAPWRTRLLRGLACAGAAALVLPPLLGWLPDFNGLGGHVGVRAFVASVFGSMLTSFGLWHRDYLLSDTFWRACGYNEVGGPSVLVSVVCLLLIAGWAMRLWLAADRPRTVWHTVFMLLACGVYLAALAVGGWKTEHGLNGRYLVGFYIFLLVGAGVGWAMLDTLLPEQPARRLRVLWLLPLLLHGSHLWALADRVF